MGDTRRWSRGNRRLVRLMYARTDGTVGVLASTGPRWQKLGKRGFNACRVRARLRPRLSDSSVCVEMEFLSSVEKLKSERANACRCVRVHISESESEVKKKCNDYI